MEISFSTKNNLIRKCNNSLISFLSSIGFQIKIKIPKKISLKENSTLFFINEITEIQNIKNKHYSQKIPKKLTQKQKQRLINKQIKEMCKIIEKIFNCNIVLKRKSNFMTPYSITKKIKLNFTSKMYNFCDVKMMCIEKEETINFSVFSKFFDCSELLIKKCLRECSMNESLIRDDYFIADSIFFGYLFEDIFTKKIEEERIWFRIEKEDEGRKKTEEEKSQISGFITNNF